MDNIDKNVAARYGTVVDDVTRADVALIEVTAPFALRPNGTGFARFYKEGLTGTNSTDITGAGQFAVAAGGALAWIRSPVVEYPDRALVCRLGVRPGARRADARADGHGEHVAALVAEGRAQVAHRSKPAWISDVRVGAGGR